MPFSNRPEKASAIKSQKRICSKCGFDNNASAVYCEICFYPLEAPALVKQSSNVKPQPTKKPTKPKVHYKQELRKPSVIGGLGVLTLAIALWVNYFVERRPKYLSFADENDDLVLYNSMSQVEEVPSGLYSYGGALYFAPLVANGMNDVILENHPSFALRYTQPQNQDPSYSNGIKMLLDGELSFAFNGRPLTESEYSQANLRGINLQQVPIAIDGIVFFGNQNTGVDGLSLDTVRDIFTGKITNWSELGGADLPIVPVLLDPENIEILGLKNSKQIPKSTQYVDNYTLAIRKAVATPGAISFASASLVKQQQLIKVFGLAPENSTNYVMPFTDAGDANLELFKSGNYPLTRRLFLVIRQDGTPDRLAGKSYAQMLLSNQGQEIIEQSGFVPLYGDR